MFKTNAIVAAALCTVGLFSAPAAFAGTVEVQYKDLDLTTTEGQAALEGRIDLAAKKVCRSERPATGTHLNSAVDQTCYRQALKDVRQHVATAVAKADDNRLGG